MGTHQQSNSNLYATLDRLRAILRSVQNPAVDDWDPLEMGLLIAKMEYEDLDIVEQRRQFQTMVDLVNKEMPRTASLRDQALHVIKFFSEQFNFEGDRTNYYNLKNSFLNDVILRRKGIPISLSLIFMALCRGVGMKAVGIAFPGHFLVKILASGGHFDLCGSRETINDWRQEWYIDCFDKGALMSVADCEKRLNEWTRGAVPFGPEALRLAHPVEIVSRVLRNLRAICAEKEDLARLYWILTALIELCPSEQIDSYRERGLLMARMGRYPNAIKDFERFLNLSSDLEKKSHVENMMRYFSLQKEQVN